MYRYIAICTVISFCLYVICKEGGSVTITSCAYFNDLNEPLLSRVWSAGEGYTSLLMITKTEKMPKNKFIKPTFLNINKNLIFNLIKLRDEFV